MKNFDIFPIFAQNIDCGCTLEPPGRGGSNEYPQSIFGAKIRKIGLPLHAPVLLYKSGVQGVYTTRTCFRDEQSTCCNILIMTEIITSCSNK